MSQFTTPPVGQVVIGNGVRGVPPMQETVTGKFEGRVKG